MQVLDDGVNQLTTSRGVRQGDIISPTLFNIIIDAIIHFERHRMACSVGPQRSPDVRFYADDGAIAGTDPAAIQASLDVIIAAFRKMGVYVNRGKTKWMYVTGAQRVNRIQHGAYCNLIRGVQDSYLDRGRQMVRCPVCNDSIQRRCIQRHISNLHPESVGQAKIDFFSPTPQRPSGPRRYVVDTIPTACPVPHCPYEATNVTSLFRHMAARHPMDEVIVVGHPGYNKCPDCQQYVKGATPSTRHLRSELCKQGKKRWKARLAAEELATQLGNLPTFYVEGEPIERVENFTYLGRVVTSTDDDLQACLRNLAKAKAKWGALSRLLIKDGASCAYRSRIYLVVVSTVLLYGAETWVLTDRIRRVLEAFHHSCARSITRTFIRRVSNREGGDDFWIYPSTAEVLKKAKLLLIETYITKRREVFFNNYLRFSHTFEDSKSWRAAGHTRNFPRYHQQNFTSNPGDA